MESTLLGSFCAFTSSWACFMKLGALFRVLMSSWRLVPLRTISLLRVICSLFCQILEQQCWLALCFRLSGVPLSHHFTPRLHWYLMVRSFPLPPPPLLYVFGGAGGREIRHHPPFVLFYFLRYSLSLAWYLSGRWAGWPVSLKGPAWLCLTKSELTRLCYHPFLS